MPIKYYMYTLFIQSEWNAFRFHGSGKKRVITIKGYDYFTLYTSSISPNLLVPSSWSKLGRFLMKRILAIKFLSSFQLSASSVLHRCPWLGFFHNVNTRLKSVYRRSDRALERNSLLYNVVYFVLFVGFFFSLFYRIACSILRLIYQLMDVYMDSINFGNEIQNLLAGKTKQF